MWTFEFSHYKYRLYIYINAKEALYDKPAWSEEDEVSLSRIVENLELLNVSDGDILLKDIDWLKSLKDRATWKPSEEQMEALLGVMVESGFDYIDYNTLESLYNDLKKL